MKRKIVNPELSEPTISSSRLLREMAIGMYYGGKRCVLIQTGYDDNGNAKFALVSPGNMIMKWIDSIEHLMKLIDNTEAESFVFDTEEEASAWRYE